MSTIEFGQSRSAAIPGAGFGPVRGRESDYTHDAVRAVFDAAGVGLAQGDLRTQRFTRANRQFCEMLGYTEAEVLTKSFFELTHPDDLPSCVETFQRFVAGEFPVYRTQKRYVRKDGSPLWVEVTATMEVGPDGEPPVRAVAVIQDITARRAAEEALRASEENFRMMFDSAGVGRVQCDAETGRFLRVNSKYCLLTGYTADELLGMTFWDVLHPEDRARQLAAPDRGYDRVSKEGLEKRYLRKDGTIIHVHVTATFTSDPANPGRRLSHAVVQDVTAAKEAERALRESEELFRATFEAAAVGNTQVDPETFRFLRANRRFTEMTGYTEAELTRMTVWDITHPDDLPKGGRAPGVVPNPDGNLKRAVVSGVEKRYVRKDGSVFWGLTTVTALRDVDGRPMLYTATTQDITAAKASEAGLRLSEQNFREMFDMAGVGQTQCCSRTGRYLRANQKFCEMVGYTEAELTSGMTCYDITHPEDRAAQIASPDNFRSIATGPGLEKRYIRKDGSVMWVRASVAILNGPDGQPRTANAVIIDITASKAADEALRGAALRTTRLLDQVFTAQEEERKRIARELHDGAGQSLTSLLLRLKVLESSDSLPAVRGHVGQLREDLAATIDDLRRIATGLRPSSLDDLGLPAALEKLATDVMRGMGLRVELDLGPVGGLALSPATETAAYRIVQEALTNTTRHAPAARVARVWFGVTGDGEGLRLSVTDDGPGFDVGERRDESHMGITSMRERAALLGGSLIVNSVKGSGTRVEAVIPLKARHVGGTAE